MNELVGLQIYEQNEVMIKYRVENNKFVAIYAREKINA